MRRKKTAIDRKLRKAWRRERRYVHVRGLSQVAVGFVVVVSLDLLVDWLFNLPGAARIALALLGVAVLGHLIVRRWLLLLRPYAGDRVALRVERLHPKLRSLLVSHVQLRSEAATRDVSPALLEAMHRRADVEVAPLSFAGIVDFRTLRRLAIFAVASTLLFAGSVFWAGDFYRVFVTRLIHPTSNARYPTRTTLVAVTGDLAVRQGDAAEIVAEATGKLPPSATLEVQFEEAGSAAETPRESVSMPADADAPGVYRHRFESTMRSFSYRVRVGDFTSTRFRVSVVPPPLVVETVVRVESPEYTGLPVREVDALSFEVLEGSRASWELLCDQALAEAELVIERKQDESGEEAIALEIDANDARRVRGELTVDEGFSYSFRWRELGNGFRYESVVLHTVRVEPDRPPRVEILSPKTDEKGTLRKQIALEFAVRDDHGCGDAWIVYSVSAGSEIGPEKRIPIGRAREGRNEPHRWRPADVVEGFAEGTVLSWRVEVSDNRRSEEGPNTGRSRTLELEVLTLDEYLQYIEERRSELFSNIRGVLDEESRGSRNVKTLKDGDE